MNEEEVWAFRPVPKLRKIFCLPACVAAAAVYLLHYAVVIANSGPLAFWPTWFWQLSLPLHIAVLVFHFECLMAMVGNGGIYSRPYKALCCGINVLFGLTGLVTLGISVSFAIFIVTP